MYATRFFGEDGKVRARAGGTRRRLGGGDTPGRNEDVIITCACRLGNLTDVGTNELLASAPVSQVMLSCVLHGSAGQYDPKAVAAWNSLAQKYGESVKF